MLLPVPPIIANHRYTSAHADQELMALTVCVFATDFYQRHLIDDEVPFCGERNVPIELTKCQVTAWIKDVREFNQTTATMRLRLQIK